MSPKTQRSSGAGRAAPRSGPPPSRSRREEILDCATRLFAARGYEGTSMSELADEVGLRKASLFHHFASKEVLYAAVLARLLEEVGAAIVENVVRPGTFAERLDAMSDGLTALLGAQPFAARLLVREVMDWGPVVRDHLADKIVRVLEAAEAFMRAGQEAGAFTPMEPRQLVISLTSLHFMPFAIGGIVERFIGAPPSSMAFVEPRREAVREQVRLLVTAPRAK
jgi:AcrR family transcriptional regulator